ncbi:hypothetical protein BC941DRAFT_407923 [Chlamydoabsidia padenii]|nr:hypothetical protein BC941DRAFT_407923 [Chlamydoabsidia padenii]
MESPPSPEKSRSQPRYTLSTNSQHLKTMATTTTTTATASAPISPRTRSHVHEYQDTSLQGCKPTPSSSSSSSSSAKKRPLPKEPPLTDTPDTLSKEAPSISSSSSTTTNIPRSSIRPTFDKDNVVHDAKNYMFKLSLDSKGNIAALCYLPTRFATLIEFYHTEVPLAYRHFGIGDLLLQRAFEWVEQSNLLVIPSCSFVLRYLKTHYPDMKTGTWNYIVNDEQTGLEKLAHRNSYLDVD